MLNVEKYAPFIGDLVEVVVFNPRTDKSDKYDCHLDSIDECGKFIVISPYHLMPCKVDSIIIPPQIQPFTDDFIQIKTLSKDIIVIQKSAIVSVKVCTNKDWCLSITLNDSKEYEVFASLEDFSRVLKGLSISEGLSKCW